MSETVDLLMRTAEADTDLIISNEQYGDVLTTPREVQFLLLAPSAEKAELVASFINDYRFGEAVATHDDGSNRISVCITMPVTQSVLCCVSGFMACLCKIYDLSYDGWESDIQPHS